METNSPESLHGEPGERTRLLQLQADVGVAIAANDAMTGCLQACAEALVRHLGAAFARIWTLSEVEPILELQASAGMYTHLNGPHGRVPMGKFKIGLIAEERAPHLTNHVVGDPRVGDQDWAEREGMVAFAGYPLLVGEKLVGVVALFARHPLTNDTLKATAAIASAIAQTIERARTQERLRVSEELLSTTLKSIGDGVIATDATGRVTFINPVAATITGWTADAAKGTPVDTVFNIINDATRARVESPVTTVLREGTVVGLSNHTLLVHRDGTETPIDDSAAPIRDSRDTLVGVVLVFRDASEKRRADAERQELLDRERAARAEAEAERARLHEVFMQAPAVICVLRGPDLVFELANPLYTQLVGGREMTGKRVREAIPELEGQGFFELLDGVMASGTPYVGNEVPASVVRDSSGKPQPGFFDFVYQPIREATGKTNGIFVLGVEVTEQVQARKALERAVAEAGRLNDELVQAEHVLRNLVDNIPELAWSARPDGHIDFYNRRWYEYTGTTFEDMEGWGWKQVHDPNLLGPVAERWQRSLDTGTPFEMEFPLRGADGEFRWFLTRVQPLRDPKGRIVRWFGVNTNIHDQREATRKTEALLAEVSDQAKETAATVRAMRDAKDKAERLLADYERRAKASL
jgi:PAS domain S-box-containing protein